MRATLVLAVCLVALPVYADEKKPITKSDEITLKTTIEAIDKTARTVTLKDKDGTYETLHAGPEIRRFDELKVGDEVTFKYTESVAVRVRKPGEPVVGTTSSDPAVVRGATAKPSGTLTQQATTTVTVKSVDPKGSSITFDTEGGRTMSVRVDDKSLVKDVKPGDKIEITYTTALLISVE